MRQPIKWNAINPKLLNKFGPNILNREIVGVDFFVESSWS